MAYGVQSLKALPDLLNAAVHARRAVLLVADHGHVRGDRFAVSRPPERTVSARARELAPDEAPWEHEVVLETGAWRSREKHRSALLFRESDCYGGSRHSGTHGGASLAEVVTPAVLIASDELGRSLDVEDRELDLRPFPRPRWWDLEATARPRSQPAPPVRREKSPEKPSRQLAIPLPEPGKASRWATLLRGSEFYKEASKKERELWETRLIPAVDLLVEHGASMPEEPFAARLGIPRFRVPGVVAELAERLNLEQHLVLVHDRGQRRVLLDQPLLERLFAG